MKRKLLLIIIVLLQVSCSNSSKIHDKWVGESKQKLIKNWGMPLRIVYDDQNEEIYLYADQVFTKNKNDDSRIAGPSHWEYNYMYVNKEGKIYLWHNEKQKFPPQLVDLKNIVGLSTQTKK